MRMKKLLAILCSITFLGLVYVKSNPKRSLEDFAKSAVHLHMVFVNPEGKQFGASCSGVYINDNGVALTAKHCVEEGDFKAQVILNVEPNGDETFVQVLSIDPAADAALVKVWNVGKTPYVKIAKRASVGDIVYAIGHPLDFPLTITKGIISNVDMEGYIVSDVLINPGSSGGAVINEKGELIGLSVAETVDMQLFGLVMTKTGYSIILPYSELTRFLDSFRNL